MTDLVPYRPRRLTRQQREAIAVADARAEVLAREDELAAARVADHIAATTRLTRHGVLGASLIAAEAEAAAQLSPWAAQQIASVAEAGFAGIRGAIADYAMKVPR